MPARLISLAWIVIKCKGKQNAADTPDLWITDIRNINPLIRGHVRPEMMREIANTC